MNINKVIDLLFKIAEDTEPVGNCRVSSAIVYKNEIISIGFNRYKTHPLQLKFSKDNNKIYLHAEMDAIIKSLKYLSVSELEKSQIFICRAKWQDTNRKKLVYGLAKPCKICMTAIQSFGINTIYYTTNHGEVKIIK